MVLWTGCSGSAIGAQPAVLTCVQADSIGMHSRSTVPIAEAAEQRLRRGVRRGHGRLEVVGTGTLDEVIEECPGDPTSALGLVDADLPHEDGARLVGAGERGDETDRCVVGLERGDDRGGGEVLGPEQVRVRRVLIEAVGPCKGPERRTVRRPGGPGAERVSIGVGSHRCHVDVHSYRVIPLDTKPET